MKQHYSYTANEMGNEPKVKVYNNEEYVVTGNYSMAPCIKSSRIVG